MSCPKTPHLLQEYFADDLSPRSRDELGRHLDSCADCNDELQILLATQARLQNWEEQRVPHWDRGLNLFRREHRADSARPGFFSGWQWLPTAASFAMLCVLLLNTSIVSNEQGFSVSFGVDAPAADIGAELDVFRAQQQQALQAAITRFEDRQDNNNVLLMQAVMDQTQQTTAENLEQIYAYFEQQRVQDLQAMRASYQLLVDSDYETIRSLENLANYVSYQGDVR